MSISFRPPHADELIAALQNAGWVVITDQDPYYNEPWLRMEKAGRTLLASFDSRTLWAENVTVDSTMTYFNLDQWRARCDNGERVPIAELVEFANNPYPAPESGDGSSHRFRVSIPKNLMTAAERQAEYEREQKRDNSAVEGWALAAIDYTGETLTGFLWFTVAGHLRDRVIERRKQLRAERRKQQRVTA